MFSGAPQTRLVLGASPASFDLDLKESMRRDGAHYGGSCPHVFWCPPLLTRLRLSATVLKRRADLCGYRASGEGWISNLRPAGHLRCGEKARRRWSVRLASVMASTARESPLAGILLPRVVSLLDPRHSDIFFSILPFSSIQLCPEMESVSSGYPVTARRAWT